jgi:hypothetical protein
MGEVFGVPVNRMEVIGSKILALDIIKVLNKPKENFIESIFEPIKFLSEESNLPIESELSRISAGTLARKLFSGTGELSFEEEYKLRQSLERAEVREVFLSTLSSIKDPIYFESEYLLQNTPTICLEVMELERYNKKALTTTMKASKLLYTIPKG